MSASTKRKTRQAEIEAGIYKKQETQRKNDEKKAKEKRTMLICAAVVAVIVVAAILLNVIPAIRSSAEQRRYAEGTAVTIGDRVYSPAEVNYYYTSQFNSIANSYYATLFGLDTSNGPSGLAKQAYNGPQTEGKEFATWRDYLLDAVHTQLGQTQTLLKYAEARGIALSEEEQAQIEQNLDSYTAYATMYGYPSVDQFLAVNFGKGFTLDMLRTLETEGQLASKAYNDYRDGLSFTDEERAEEYASFNGDYDTYSYAFYRVGAEAAEGEEPTAEAVAEAEAEADAIMASYQDGDDVEDLFDRFNGYIEEELGGTATRSDDVTGSYLSTIFSDWMKDESRAAGDVTKIADGNNFYVVLFLDHKDAAYPTVNVRHILIQAQKAEGEETWSEEELAAAKAEAERILAEWEAGEKTEESFAALAEEYSEDSGSSANGGLYENVYKGQMVKEFNEFCFAEGRQPGDTGIVYGTNGNYAGYHVMYYVGEGELYSVSLADDSLRQKAMTDWMAASELPIVPGADEVLVDPA